MATRITRGGNANPVALTEIDENLVVPVNLQSPNPLPVVGTFSPPAQQAITFADSPNIDGFARLRVSNPETLFDSKQIFDNQPLFWDDEEVSGGGTTSNHSSDLAATVMGVGATTVGKRVRQTFRYFNYETGKSFLVLMTWADFDTATGITKRVGYFNDDNGLFFQSADGVISVVRRTYTSGAAVDNVITQANWNLDTLDGTGASGVTLDFTKTQIGIIDFEWLGVGRVRMGFVIDGIPIYCHQFLNANVLPTVYMSKPNLPLRYSIENDGNGAADTFSHICSTVMSEGGTQATGIVRSASTGGTELNATTAGTVYAVLGIRLKSAYIGTAISLLNFTMINENNDDFEAMVLFNPTVAGTFTYVNLANSAIQVATGVDTNTVSGGVLINSKFAIGTGGAGKTEGEIKNALQLGAAIDGTLDEIVLAVRPLTNGPDIQGSLTWRELL